ncbi:Hypothetical protein Nlim_0272 [Candidatus Nitrosarchaeum limnium SFB1]|uniref:Uncharacterized protein n=1 Tax=Candidatus Nitrosarchaeum limnium SFB1 TaxID=886738 RepID=F3KIH4_9ARCH|nr:Hypothetical protein Nlim_0272 [Candidatus Nitrosarchaeum limnium SFB1]
MLIAREYIAKRVVTVIATGNLRYILTYPTMTQDTCPHDAKVKMAGYSELYECTRCHKFIRDLK